MADEQNNINENSVKINIRAVDQTGATINKVTNKIEQLTVKVKNNTKIVNSSLTGAITRINSSLNSVANTIRTAIIASLSLATNKVLQMGMQVEVMVRKMNYVFGNSALGMKKWAEKISDAYGSSLTDVLKLSTDLGVQLKAIGINEADIANTSQRLTVLIKDLSALHGLSEEEVEFKILSGLRGNIQAIDDLGISMRKVDLNALTKRLNLGNSYSDLDKTTKAYVTLINIIEQSKDIDGFALGNADTAMAKFNRLKSGIKGIATTIGQIFTAIFDKIYIYIDSIVKFVQNALNSIAGMLNIKVGIDDKDLKSGKVASGVNNIKDSLEETEEQAKKTKNSVASFDEVINLSKSDDNNNNSLGVEGLSGLLDEYKMPEINTKETEKSAEDGVKSIGEILNDIPAKIEEKLPVIKEGLGKITDEFNETGSRITGRADFDIGFNADDAVDSVWNTINNISSIIKTAGKFIITLAFKIADDINIGAIFNGILDTIESFTYAVDEALKAITPALDSFYESGLRPIVEWVGEKLKEALYVVSSELTKFGDWFKEIAPDLEEFADKLGGVVNTVWSFIEPFADTAWNIALQVITGLLQGFRDLIEFLLKHSNATILILTTLGGAFAGIKISGLIASLGNFIGLMGGVGPAIASVVSSLVGPLTSAISGLWGLLMANPIGALIGAIAGLVVAGVALYNKSETFRNFINRLWEGLKQFGSWLASGFVAIFKVIGDEIGYRFNNLKQIFSGLIDFIKGVFTGNWRQAWEGIKNIFIGIFKNITAPIRTPLNFLIDMMNRVIDGFNSLHIEVPDWVPKIGGRSFGINIPKIPKLATGGIALGSSLVNIGEAGREAVIPLENNLGYLEGFADILADRLGRRENINVNINAGAVLDARQQKVQLARIIQEILTTTR